MSNTVRLDLSKPLDGSDDSLNSSDTVDKNLDQDLDQGLNQDPDKDKDPEGSGNELAGETQAQPVREWNDENVFSFLSEKTGREIKSLDDLTVVEEKEMNLPEPVKQFFEYNTSTGRGMDDFIKLNRDFKSLPEEALIKEHIAMQNPDLDQADIDFMYNKKYVVDEDDFDDSHSRQVEIDRKLAAKEALKFFESEKEKYVKPIESTGTLPPDFDQEEFNEYLEAKKSKASTAESVKQNQVVFEEKTNALFNDQFKGFEFDMGDKKLVFEIEDIQTVKNSQSNLMNFISQFTDKNGTLVDAEKFHKALHIGSNIEKYAKFFYEQGKTEGLTLDDKTSKNLGERRVHLDTGDQNGFKVRSVDNKGKSNGEFKIRKRE